MHNKGKVYKTLIFAFAAFIFAGCENFIAGSLLKEEIEAKIEYEKTPFVNVFIQKSDVDDNGTLYPSADGVKAKVGESFKISYTASSTYYFLYWQALDSKKNILDSSVVKFDDSAKAATSAVVYIDSEVIIQAVTSPVPKAVVNFKKNFDAAGSVISEDKNTFMMDEELDFSFVPAEGYQFIKWQASNSSIEIKNPESISSKAVAKADGAVTITAICAERPHVGMGNTNPTQTDSVCKDTNIIIDFDKPLGNSEEELSDIKLYLNNVELYYGEEEAFGEPYYKKSDDTADTSRVIIPAHSKYAVDVPAGKTSSIRVVLSDSLFTLDEEENCIYLCPEGKTYSWTYKINENTNDKAKISVKYEPIAGIVTGNNGVFNIGKTVEYLFKPFESTKFISWKWVCVPDEAAVIKTSTDNNGEKISFYINEACDINVEAVTAEKLTVASFAPVSKVEGVAKNSDIVITFNKAVVNTDAQDLEKVKILLDGVDVKNCYHLPPLVSEDRKTITFKADNKKLLPVEKGTKIVTVIVPSDFYYDVSEAVKVNLEEYSKSFVVNASTLEKANVNINTTKGTISPSGAYSYNLGDSFDVLYKTESGYKFTGWIIEKGNAKADLIENTQSNKFFVRFYDDESKSTYKDCFEVTFTESVDKYQASFTVLEEISGCSIRPSYSLIPSVISMVPAFSNSGTAFDENIEIEFNKSMSPECFKGFYSEDVASTQNYAVSITDKNGMDLSELFNLPKGSEDNKKWTIRPDAGKIQTLLATETFADIYVTVKTSAKDNSEEAMNIEKDFVKIYRINKNHETIPPKFVDFVFASSHEKLLNQVYCTDKPFASWSDEKVPDYKYGDFSQNHVNNSLYFKFKVSEQETGLEKLVISETRVRSVTAQTVNEKTEDTVIDLSLKGSETEFDFNYTFKSENDGVIEIKFTCFDKVGNTSVKTVYAIRDTVYNKSFFISNNSGIGVYPYNLENDKEKVTSITIKSNTNDTLYDVFYGNYVSDLDDIEASVEYLNDGRKFIAPVSVTTEKNSFNVKLDKDGLKFDKNTYLKVSLKDKAGNENVRDRVIPSCVDIFFYEIEENFKAYPQFDGNIDVPYDSQRIYYKNKYSESYTNDYCGLIKFEKNMDYYLRYETGSRQDDFLYGLVKHFVIKDSNISSIPDIQIPSYTVSIEQGEKSSGTFTATVTLNSIDKNTDYYYAYTYSVPDNNSETPNNGLSKYTRADINNGKAFSFTVPYDSITGSYNQRPLQNKKLFMKLQAIKNGYSVNETAYVIVDVEGDCAPPRVYVAENTDPYGLFINRGKNSLTVKIKEDSGYKTDSKGYGVMEYTLTPVSDTITEVSQIEDLTEKEWNSKTQYSVKFNPEEQDQYKRCFVDIPFAVIQPDVTYRIDTKVEDSLGNTKITKAAIVKNQTKAKFPEITCERVVEDGKVKLELKIDETIRSYIPYGFGWKYDGTGAFYNFNPGGKNPYNFASSSSYLYEDGSFYCVCGNDGWNLEVAGEPYYYLLSDNREANLKNIIEGAKGVSVLCDNKTLLFTAYTKYDFGTDFKKWNRCASKTGFAQLDKISTYSPDIDSVPEGFYYCIIAIFADGDYAMTTPKIK